jgi:hypothetical protein
MSTWAETEAATKQIPPPGVLLPRLSVTRFTASARPLNEGVSNHCRAFALP